jgi:hypothetical protein
MLGSISDLKEVVVQWSRWWKYCSFARHHTNLKNLHTNRFCMVTPIVSSKYRRLYQFCYVKLFSTNQNGNLLLLDDPGRVRSQIRSVVCQIERDDFDCNMVVTRKVITWTHPPLRSKPLYCACKKNCNFIHHFINGFITLQGYNTLVQHVYWLRKILLVYTLQSTVLLECVQ